MKIQDERLATIQALLDSGMSARSAGAELGLARYAIYEILRNHPEIKWERWKHTGRPLGMLSERALDIAQRRRNGETIAEISKHYGVSRQRIDQIMKRYSARTGERFDEITLTNIRRAAQRRRKPFDYTWPERWCPVCGAKYRRVRGQKNKTCSSACAVIFSGKKILTDQMLISVIEKRDAGLPWNRAIEGLPVSFQTVQRGIYCYLIKHKSLTPEIVSSIWQNGANGHLGNWLNLANRYGWPTETGIPEKRPPAPPDNMTMETPNADQDHGISTAHIA